MHGDKLFLETWLIFGVRKAIYNNDPNVSSISLLEHIEYQTQPKKIINLTSINWLKVLALNKERELNIRVG